MTAAPVAAPAAEVFRPADVAEAVRFLADHPGAVPIAGGTDVMIDRRLGRLSTGWLVDISHLDTGGIVRDGDDLTIGATTTIRSIETSRELADTAPALVEAARVLGSVQIRNMATLGGNLCHATPSAEMPPPLLVFGSSAALAGPSGERSIDLADLATGPGTTSLAPGEMLVSVTAAVPDGIGSCYIRQTIRWAMDLAGAGVAASVETDGDTVTALRVGLGAVSPIPMLVPGLDDIAVGHVLDPDVLAEAAARARDACSPISDARGTADYRRHVVAVLTARAIRIAAARARGTWPIDRLAPPNGFDPEVLPGRENGPVR
ncbi:MAG: xanthine dehydrogenase family protein subunit M [Acidimicrobiaceae bacterium]|nr:xanthine dehydrogenase family protein subunit M [Acidimicrobiaceae bacterium]